MRLCACLLLSVSDGHVKRCNLQDQQTWVFFICREHRRGVPQRHEGYKRLSQDVALVAHVWSHTDRHSLAAAVPLWQPCWLHSLVHGCCHSNWCWSAESWASCPGTAVEDTVTYFQQGHQNEIKEQLLSLWNPEHGPEISDWFPPLKSYRDTSKHEVFLLSSGVRCSQVKSDLKMWFAGLAVVWFGLSFSKHQKWIF